MQAAVLALMALVALAGSTPHFERKVLMQAVQADVVVADYELIRRDFACLAAASAADIDAWLVEHTAYMRAAHVHRVPEHMRPLRRAAPPVVAQLPPMYGRAAVIELDACGGPRYLDVKGTGTDWPQPSMHASGVLELSKAVQEFMMGAWLRHAAQLAPRLDAVRLYAVLRVAGCADFAPTLYQAANGSWLEAPASCGILVREFARRPKAYLFADEVQLDIESALHAFGLTGVVPYVAHRYGLNVSDSPLVLDFQATCDGRLIDLNTVVVWSPDVPALTWSSQRGPLLSIAALEACFPVTGSGVLLSYADCLAQLRSSAAWSTLAPATEQMFASAPPRVSPLGVLPLHHSPSGFLKHSWWALCGDQADHCREQIVGLLTAGPAPGRDHGVFATLLQRLHAALHRFHRQPDVVAVDLQL